MWCIPVLTDEFIERMEQLLDLYAKPYNPMEPVLCFDEKSKELHKDAREPILGKITRRDYEYVRNSTANIFVTVEPKGGFRTVQATAHRKKPDFAHEMKRVINLPRYRNARLIHMVLDNLNTHFEPSLIDTFGLREAKRMMKRIRFHYTPKHASWLNMAEIEIGAMSRQAIKGRIPTPAKLKQQLAAWQRRRNKKHAMIQWIFTKQDARKKLNYKGA